MKRINFLFIVGGIIFLIAILTINILIKKYEKSLTTSQDTTGEVLKKETPVRKLEQELPVTQQEIESQSPTEEGLLLN